MKYMIDSKTGVSDVNSIFVNIQKLYNYKLRSSIDRDIVSGLLPRMGNPLHYNYLIMDGTELNRILAKYNRQSLLPAAIDNQDFEDFRQLCDYAGKGTNARKLSHLVFGKQILLKKLALKKISSKFSRITRIWEKNHGIVVLHLFTESNHYEALSREYALIMSLGLNNLTNAINGCAYGAMKTDWNHFEIVNYGNMLLYNAFKMHR